MSGFKKTVLLIGDAIFFYVALTATLLIRYGATGYAEALKDHLFPFSALFILSTAGFAVLGLYDLKNAKSDINFFRLFGIGLLIIFIIALAIFYLAPFITVISPRRNLLLFIAIFGILDYGWRTAFYVLTAAVTPLIPVFIGASPEKEKLSDHLRNNPQLGYAVTSDEKNASIIVMPTHMKKDHAAVRVLYEHLNRGIEIISFSDFYEQIFGKTPLVELEESWFLEHIAKQKPFYEGVKSAGERLAACMLLVFLLPLMIILAALILITSGPPVIYRQVRVGKGGKEFILYKFRTMRPDAEKDGARWAEKNDRRVTAIGRILRATHLDELPQLINIVKGELSIVGPRPERPEFVSMLMQEIPHYGIRHLVKPGVTGWAQINYRYGASVEDAREKLQYDIYYLKERSFALDALIILKTAKLLFVNNK